MIFKNATVMTEDFTPHKLDVRTQNGRIAEMGENLAGGPVLDCAGLTLAPGFVDIHTHGAVGADATDGDVDGLQRMADYLFAHGVTSFCPTTMTAAHDTIVRALQAIRTFAAGQRTGARAVGVHLEGPYISAEKKGAQALEHVRTPDFEEFSAFYAASGNNIRLVSVAPECDTAGFIEKAAALCTVSIAHTTANYDEAKAAFARGVTHATHLFNAMNGLSHRAPGVVGAVFDTPTVTGELICDGIHIHPSVLRLAFRELKGRVCVVSDAMRGAGLPDGDYDLGGQQVTVRAGKATLADGTIAGSATNLHTELKNLVSFGVPFAEALRAMTLTPAREIGLAEEIGSIAPGKRADFVLLNDEQEIVRVFSGA